MRKWLNFSSSLSTRQTIASLPQEEIERGPMRSLGTTLVTAMVALTTLIAPSLVSAQSNFTLAAFGPQNVVQGRPLYFVLTVTPVSGTSPTMVPVTVAGLPAG